MGLGHPDEIVLERILCDLFARRFQYPIGAHVTAHAVPYTAGKAWRPTDSGNGKYSFKAGSDTPEYEEYTSTKELPQEVIDEMETAVNQATNNK